MIRFIKNIIMKIKMKILLRKKIKALRKRDPFIYK
jgi:hypothetical protein